MRFLDRLLAVPGGRFGWLLPAALLEVFGDAFFQSAVHRASGASRGRRLPREALSLFFCGLVVNLPRWNFGQLLGIYAVLFFVTAQVIRQSEVPRSRQLASFWEVS